MSAHTVLPDSIRQSLGKGGGGRPEPPDLADLRAGKTVFWSLEDGLRRILTIRNSLRYHRARGQESRRLVMRRTTVEGNEGYAGWLEAER